MRITTLWAFRIFYFGLILFEILNGIKILNFTVDFTWIGLVVTGLAAWLGIEFINNRIQDKEQAGFLLGLVLIAVGLDAFGDMLNLYKAINHYDKIIHFINSGIICYVLYNFFKALGKSRPALLGFLTTAGLGLLYEIEEFAEDMALRGYLLRSGGKIDTTYDIIMNVSGSGLAIILIMMANYLKKRNQKYD